MQKTATTPSKILDLTAAAFLLVAFLTGIAGALQTPTLSIFLADELKARPIMVGFFFTGSAIMGILVSQFLARHSDKQGDRKLLILLCCLFGVLACTLFAWNRNYFILLSTGVLLSSFASTANPQMFALAREHADRTGRETVMFSTFLRAQISLAWVIGPPLAYELAMGFSFKVMYLTAAIAFVVCGLIVWLFLPSIQRNIPVVTQPVEILPSTHRKRDTRLLFVVCSMMWAANNLYMINMPLFIIDELHLTDKLAGEMIGIAAGLEIPMMLIAGYYMKRIGKRLLMLIAIVSGMCFYASVLMATTPAVELELQILNAIFLGILCGIGMLYFQDLMPEKIGSATTLYANTSRVGWIIAGSVDGIMVEIWSYHALFWLAIGMLGIAMICLLFMLTYLKKKKLFTFKISAFNCSDVLLLIQKAIPSVIQQSIPAISTTSLTALVSTYSVTAIAAYGVTGKLETILFYPAMALNMVLTTIIGQCAGGARYDRAKDYLKCALGYGCGLLVILSVLVVGFSKQLSGLFVRSSDVAVIVGTYFLIVSIGYVLNTVTNCYLGALNGMGKPSISMFLMIFYYIVVRMPLAYLLSYLGFGLNGIWVAVLVSHIVASLAATMTGTVLIRKKGNIKA